jgi:SAM-dependent methyltransferase
MTRAADRSDFRRVRRRDFYGSDTHVGEMTRAIMSRGIRHLQVHRLASDDDAHMRELVTLFAPPHGATVLDVGCGIGAPASALVAIRPDLRVILLNRSKKQLDLCSVGERVCGDFHRLPLADGSVNAAMVLYALGHALLSRVMRELYRVLAVGGVLFIWDIAASDPRPVIDALGYRPHPPSRVIDEADSAGFVLDRWVLPLITDNRQFAELLGYDCFSRVFASVFPVAYRFVRWRP